MSKFLLLVFFLVSFSFLLSKFSYAELSSIPECRDKNLDKAQCEKYLSDKLVELQGQKRTLASQIAVMDSQINLTEARIESTKEQISGLAADINTATKKINNLENSLESLIKTLLNRMVATYEIGQSQPFGILLTSDNATNFFSRLNYLKVVRDHDKQLIILTQQAKSDYKNQKDIFELKKKKIEALKSSLESYTAQLEQSKRDKEAFLLVTSNDATKYQQLLLQAQAERSIVFGGGTDSFMRDVNQGDSIGFIASYSTSPGCSNGAHLHFEVQKDGVVQDPSNYLRTGNYSYDYREDQYGYYGTINPPHGDLPWPLNEPVVIHQGYGSHGFAQQIYSGGVHTGIDMDASSSTVKAVKSGKLYGGSYNCTNGKLYYAKVIHDGGLVTWYLHTIPN